MAREPRSRWQSWISLLGWGAVVLSTTVAGRKLYSFALTSPHFRLEPAARDVLTITGAVYAPRKKIAAVFAEDFGKSSFAVSLAERRRRLLAIDWVEDAVVSRVWPSRLVVHVTERKPVAFVHIRGRSRVLLIDAHGVLLERPPQARFAFPVLRGVSEEQTERERKVRVAAMLALLEDLGPFAKDVSEVDVTAIDNLKVVVTMENQPLELMLGDANYAARYQNFLNHYPEIRKRTATAAGFDLRLDDRITAMERVP